MLDFGVSKNKTKKLYLKMQQLNIRESRLEEKFILSNKKGGQKKDKNSNAVYLKHIESGISVKCSKSRYQNLNRYYARKMLCEKLELIKLGTKSDAMKKIDKIRKQKKKRKSKSKNKYNKPR